MTMRMRAAVLGPLLALIAGCPQDTTTPEPINIDIAVDKTEVVANGTNTVQITLNHDSDVKVVASRGKFKDQKAGSVTIPGGTGTVELITCDSREVVGCAGTVRISANSLSGDATGSTRIAFTALENCGNGQDDNADGKTDCADEGCVGYVCALPQGSVGAGTCQANGTCLCNGNGGAPEPNESSCADSKDNDCDGLVDCKDANCETKACILPSGGQGICLGGECGCPGTTEEDPEACSDQIDNDCDGRVDCDDRGCQAKLGEPGVTCDEFGRTCSRGSPDGGYGTCSVCPGGEVAEVTCNDQKDNDCDGLTDCEDPHCAQATCGENGRICANQIQPDGGLAPLRCICSGNGGGVESSEVTCGDGADNDCDGKADCLDDGCQPSGSVAGRACGINGFFCTGDGKCGCSGNGGAAEDKETACADGADNDCDGLVDCAETACQPVGNAPGQICNTVGHLVTGVGELTCSPTVTGPSTCTVCSVPGGLAETAEGVGTASGVTPSCGDGLDNDCDGPMDCGDPTCTGLPCDLTGRKCAANGQCTCTASPAGPEQVCTDGLDNDCDGKVDCADTTCDNRGCVLPNGVAGRCRAGACGCPGVAEDSDAACSDGIDDDCDGLIDCEDPECQGTLAAAGKACDPNGTLCGRPNAEGMATCSICSRNEPSGETRCTDGEDNDCDGLKDCSDPDCAGRSCGANGVACNGSTQACECTGNGGTAESSEVSCNDGIDNDCDGAPDCRDTQCQPTADAPGAACGPSGFRCSLGGTCGCSPPDGGYEPAEVSCGDGVDNDCDGLTDCSDVTCQAVGNQPGRTCNSLGHATTAQGELTCSAGTLAGGSTCSICNLPSGITSEYGGIEGQATASGLPPTCSDGTDNDCNGPIDCADPNCTGQPCYYNVEAKLLGTCTGAGTCACAKTEAAESSCDDGLDNDCDGLSDCADPSCNNLRCVYSKSPRNPNQYVYGVCGGLQGCVYPGEPEDGGTTCSDGLDNDGDTLSDCEDPQCQTVQLLSSNGQYLVQPGQLCDTLRGLRCGKAKPDAGGIATCSVCDINIPLSDGGMSDETSCFDGLDNDCDGLSDCADTTCQPASGTGPGRACRPDGGWACGGGGTCNCYQADGGAGEAAETTCDDGFDNDCDTLADCEDPDCRPASGRGGGTCGPNGRACDSSGQCACSPPDGGFEAAETTCSDGVDNDCDGFVDCSDVTCQSVGNQPGKVCNTLDHASSGVGELTCSAGTLAGGSSCSVCSLPQGVTSEFGGVEGQTNASGVAPTCGDGMDNDCNGPIDCADPNCTGQPCNVTGSKCTASGTCSCVKTETAETSCGDTQDNDCDGLVDCADPNCGSLRCVYAVSPRNPNQYVYGVCATGQGCVYPGEPEDAGTTCSDALDNDGDTLSDCEDPDCQAVRTLTTSGQYTARAGQFCDTTRGLRCGEANPDAGGVATCSVCDVNEPLADGGISDETSCFDGVDNDCDGLSDCADTTCKPASGTGPGRACKADGGWSCGGGGTCDCFQVDGGAGEAAETTCDDGFDNDCDTLADCEDPDCRPSGALSGKGCGSNGRACDSAGLCVCSPADGGFEAAETTCSDGVDNDCDGLVDCSDVTCQSVGNQPGKVCNTLDHASSGVGELTCSAGTLAGGSSCSVCTLPAGITSEYGGVEGQTNASGTAPTCGDGVDNDCNGPIDCADPNCTGEPCNATGSKCTASGTCSCVQTEAAETSCDDTQDNDCDGLVDCSDTNCGGLRCIFAVSPRNPNQYVYGVCAAGQGCVYPGQPEDAGTTCSDALDNDGDTLSDCEDPDCQAVSTLTASGQYASRAGQFCDTLRGLRCGEGRPDAGGFATCSVCDVNEPLADGGISDEISCADGVDNDCDGLSDCADTTCKPASGTGPGRACKADGGWSCGGGGTCDCFQADGGAGEAAETTCDDGVDNDCDNLADCQDPDCRPSAAVVSGRTCAANGKTCDLSGQCSCSPPDGGFEAAETTCYDGLDNDCDGLTDCQEPTCKPIGNQFGKVCGVSDPNVSFTDRRVLTQGNSIGEMTCSNAGACTVCVVPGTNGNPGITEGTEGAAGVPVSANVTCGDGLDNDCDGKWDCQDSNCLSKQCDANGKVCGADGQCNICPGGSTETDCSDGLDNDCDGKTDCADQNCQPFSNTPGQACGTHGKECTTAATCVCSGNGGTAEQTEATCGDDVDNDCDGLKDCVDPDCKSSDFNVPNGRVCDDPDPNAAVITVGQRCDAFGACVCPGGQAAETSCSDGLDNDCDGKVDCGDPDCQPPADGGLGQPCNNNGMRCAAPAASASTGSCTDCRPVALGGIAGEAAEVTCYDTIDNDCDGKSDCTDPDCQPAPSAAVGRPCKGPSSSQVCLGTGGCADPTADGTVTLTAAATKIASDGRYDGPEVAAPVGDIAETLLTATGKFGPPSVPASQQALANLTCSVTSGGATYQNQGLVFTITAGSGTLVDPADATRTSTTSLCIPTNAAGEARVTLRANNQAETTKVKASFHDLVGTYLNLDVESSEVAVAQPRFGTIASASQTVNLMGARGSGFNESQTVTFVVKDADTNTYPAGLTVYFRHESRGGSYLGATPTCSGTPRICTATATTSASGQVSVVLNSGNLASLLYVTAYASAGGASGSVTLTNIAVVGAKTSGTNMSMSCESRTDPADATSAVQMSPPVFKGALVEPDYFDCSKSFYRVVKSNNLVNARFTCTGFFGDRYGNVIAVPTLSTLVSEAGNVLPTGQTPPATSATAPAGDGWIVNGQSINVVQVTGYLTPQDVAPNSGELNQVYDGGCGARTTNIRDTISATVLTVSGEEGFIDGSNGCPADGLYSPAGTTQPDGGVGCLNGRGENFIDLGEPFVDVNDNNTRDNGEFFIDSNSDGIWNGPNGVWDQNTTLWMTKRVAYSHKPASDGTAFKPILATKDDKTTALITTPTDSFALIVMATPDADAGYTVLSDPQAKATEGTFYAWYTDNYGVPTDPGLTYTPGDESQAAKKPTLAWGATTVDASDVPRSGWIERIAYCDKNPAAVPAPDMTTAACAANCSAVDGAGACYPYNQLTLSNFRKITQKFTATGSGTTNLGMGASLTLRVGTKVSETGETSPDTVTHTARSTNAAQQLKLCVQESGASFCEQAKACNTTINRTDACGIARAIQCDQCGGGLSCCGVACLDLTKDNSNCGSCGTACGGGKTCQNGSCACPTGQIECTGTCITASSCP